MGVTGSSIPPTMAKLEMRRRTLSLAHEAHVTSRDAVTDSTRRSNRPLQLLQRYS